MLSLLLLLTVADTPRAEVVYTPVPVWVERYLEAEARQRVQATRSWKEEIAFARERGLFQRAAQAQKKLKALPEVRLIPELPTPFAAGDTGRLPLNFSEVRVERLLDPQTAEVTLRYFEARQLQLGNGVPIPRPAATHDTTAVITGVDTFGWTLGSWQKLEQPLQFSADASGFLQARAIDVDREIEPYRRQWQKEQKRRPRP